MMSKMRQEILEIPAQLQVQLMLNVEIWQAFSIALKARSPKSVMTVARGSSDHAATYAKYLFETELHLPTSSAAPSIISIYKTPLELKDTLVVAISQSGQSPDLLEVMRYAKTQGALTLALVNDTSSPLAALADFVIPLHAGPELAVAATKSFLLTLTALLHGVAIIKNNASLLDGLAQLPSAFSKVLGMDLSLYFSYFVANNALILGRGFSFSIAQEIAIKFKEVTQIHAEAFSSAEILHGPFSLLKEPLPILALTQHDLSLPSMLSTLIKIKTTSVNPLIFCSEETADTFKDFSQKVLLPSVPSLLTPLLSCALLYLMIEALARAKNLNPDQPPLIQKITRTQ
jgi:glucosamine--fructose-6-phosphate aminotransferase (isomerizing)